MSEETRTGLTGCNNTVSITIREQEQVAIVVEALKKAGFVPIQAAPALPSGGPQSSCNASHVEGEKKPKKFSEFTMCDSEKSRGSSQPHEEEEAVRHTVVVDSSSAQDRNAAPAVTEAFPGRKKLSVFENNKWEPWRDDEGNPLICGICKDEIPQCEQSWHSDADRKVVYHESCSYQQEIKTLSERLAALSSGGPHKWALETMQLINKLTPDIEGKAFDPDWFLLRQRLEQVESAGERQAALLGALRASREWMHDEAVIAATEEHARGMRRCAGALDALLKKFQ